MPDPPTFVFAGQRDGAATVPNLRRIGREAEDRAADYLLGLGYTIVTRRFKGAQGEIDLVALDGETLVIVEVKLSRTPFRRAEEGLDDRKARQLATVTDEYLHKSGLADRRLRYDLVAIDETGLRHHVDAFRPEAR